MWQRTYRADPAIARIAARHYTAHHNRSARQGKTKFDLPGKVIHLYVPGPLWPFEVAAAWVWWRPPSDVRMDGYNGWWLNALFRNETSYLSSDLIREAVQWAEDDWGPAPLGFDTYVWPDRLRSTNPGYCYLMAGWSKGACSKDGKKRRLYQFA